MQTDDATLNDRLVTVFGGSGFVGRYVVQALLKAGARVRIVSRDPRETYFLRSQGGLGQTQFMAADIRRPELVARAVASAHGVVNLVGVMAGALRGIHVDGARNIASASDEVGARALVHVSALGADATSPALYARTKSDGETAVRERFPGATILRPSVIFGREDQFINRFANLIRLLPVVPVIGGGAKFQPVYVGDVARAIVAALQSPAGHGGQRYDLGGPEVLSMAELNAWIARATGHGGRVMLPVPDKVSALLAKAGDWLPGAPLTPDQWTMLEAGSVVSGRDGLALLAIEPTPLAAVADGWLVRYRRRGRFNSRFA
jgi:uncharacterized protein YbjT (DUF2867 family)